MHRGRVEIGFGFYGSPNHRRNVQFSNLILDLSRDVGTLTLNRPDKLNALSPELLTELIRAAEQISESDVRTVVVNGAGRAFCVGVDIGWFTATINSADTQAMHAAFDLGREMADAIEGIPQVTVAALHGAVVGGGLVLAAACDLRVAADDTVLSIPEIDLGIPLAWGGIARLVREIGPALTKELVMTGRPFSSREARAGGFVNRIVPPDDVQEVAIELAATIASKPLVTTRMTKAHVAEVLAGAAGRDEAAAAVESLTDPESATVREAYLAALAARR